MPCRAKVFQYMYTVNERHTTIKSTAADNAAHLQLMFQSFLLTLSIEHAFRREAPVKVMYIPCLKHTCTILIAVSTHKIKLAGYIVVLFYLDAVCNTIAPLNS